jgi:hypothetical protein
MDQKILGISGAKQSGKTTCTNFLHGYQLRLHDVVTKFMMNDEGDLLVNAMTSNEKGDEEEGVGVLDVFRLDNEFVDYASQMVWPYVKAFSFADPLKLMAMHLFGLTEQQCYGSDEYKNTKIPVKRKFIKKLLNRDLGDDKFLTAREFLQLFGTDVCRAIKPDVWTSSCLDRVKESDAELAIVSDCRFPNEIDAIKNAEGRVIRLTRCPYDDGHESETALTNEYEKYDHVIDNANLNMDEANRALMDVLKEWGWLQSKVG